MKIETAIAGASYRPNGIEITGCLCVGQRFRLETEPSNPHDRNAVKVLVDGYGKSSKTFHLGYIPRKWSGTVTVALQNDDFHVWALKENNMWGTLTVYWENVADDPLA